jgi:hypothetical protein
MIIWRQANGDGLVEKGGTGTASLAPAFGANTLLKNSEIQPRSHGGHDSILQKAMDKSMTVRPRVFRFRGARAKGQSYIADMNSVHPARVRWAKLNRSLSWRP